MADPRSLVESELGGQAVQVISKIDTAYVLLSAFAILFMTPGLALFYGGLVREKGAVDMMIQNFIALGLMSIMWFLIGFSLSYAPGNVIGNPLTYALFREHSWQHKPWGSTHISGLLFAIFQMKCAIIAPILMTGAIADRMRFAPLCVLLLAWSLLVYYPWCKQVWGGGFFQQSGVWDFAGGIVVHTTAGWSALAAVIALGRRQVKVDGAEIPEPHSTPIVCVGTGILWFGWFGFNGGSALAADETAVTAIMNTHLAAAAAMTVWGVIDWCVTLRPKLVPLCIGCVAGLVVVTPVCGYITNKCAVFSGCWAGVVCYGAVWFLNRIKVDDALDVWGVHGVGGATGSILLGVLADGPECLEQDAPIYCVSPHTVASGIHQVLVQSSCVLLCCVWSFVMTFAIVKVLMLVMNVKPKPEQFDNLDMELHDEQAYLKDK